MRQIWAVIILLLLLLLPSGPVAAQGQVAQWLRYDVTVSIQQNSGVSVEEVHEVSLVSGATTFSRVIPTDRLSDISNVTVLEIPPSGNQRNYQLADTQAEFTFEIIREANQQIIRLHFPPNNVSSTRFVFRYFVTGSLSFYNEGDRFDWRPFGNGAPAPIASSNIVIRLPGQFTEAQVSRESTGLNQVNSFFSEGNKVTFNATNIPADSELEVSVIFPHGAVEGSASEWQTTSDLTPIFQWGSVILGVLMLFGSLAAVFGWWYLRIRVSPDQLGKVPKYLGGPPSKLPPAVAGMLLDGKTTPNHLLATLVDLAQGGALNIDQVHASGDTSADNEAKPDFYLYGVDLEKAGKSYQSNLYTKIFGHVGGKQRKLSEVRSIIYRTVPEFKDQIELEVIATNYRSEKAGIAKRQYAAFGGAGLLISLVFILIVVVLLGTRFTYLVVCPFVGLGIGAIALMMVGFAAPKLTDDGLKEAARWEAFKRYLKNMGVKDAAKAQSKFSRLLPYAVAFGLEKEMIEKFGAANTPAPEWWGKPEEKISFDYSHAHSWVGNPSPDIPKETKKTKSHIRRLGESAEKAPKGALLKHIKPGLLAFLEVGHDVFAKSPPVIEGVSEEATAGQKTD